MHIYTLTHTRTVRLSVGMTFGGLCAMSHLPPPPPPNSSLAPAKTGLGRREMIWCKIQFVWLWFASVMTYFKSLWTAYTQPTPMHLLPLSHLSQPSIGRCRNREYEMVKCWQVGSYVVLFPLWGWGTECFAFLFKERLTRQSDSSK